MVGLARSYGAAVESIYFIAFLRSGNEKPRATLEGHYQQFHDYLCNLPKVTFRRKLKRIEIRFLSQAFVADDDASNKLSGEKCYKAAKEVAETLPLVGKRIKPTDDFDLGHFLADATQLLATDIKSAAEWESICKEAKEKRRALWASKSPWELLEIDWSQYHPKAREILDDPFYWECADDLAPHGNDTGADLMEDYRRWDKRNPTRSPMLFLAGLFEAWDIEPIDWNVTAEDKVKELDEKDTIALRVSDEAAIALAFAVVKIRGSCPSKIIQMALAALVRSLIFVKNRTLSTDVKAAWNKAIARMQDKLESLKTSNG